MGSYGNMDDVDIPVASTTPGPDYAEQVSATLQVLYDVLNVAVTPAGMSIDDDLDMKVAAVYSALLNAERVTLENKSSALNASTFPISLYMVDGELYFNDNAGNQVQITDGGAVNASALAGITGSGYGSSGVEVNWDSANSVYRLRDGTGTNDFADVAVDDVLLNDGSGNTVTVGAPSISSDYTLTLPTAVPGSTSLVTMSSGGALATSRDPSVDTVTTTGNIVVGDDLTVTNDLVVSNGDVTLTSGNLSVSSGTLSATDVKYQSAQTLLLPGHSALLTGNSSNTGATSGYVTLDNIGAVIFSLPLRVGDRLSALSLHYEQTGAGTTTVLLYSVNAGIQSSISLSSNTRTTTGSFTTIDPTFTATTLAANTFYRVDVSTTGTSCEIYGLEVGLTRP